MNLSSDILEKQFGPTRLEVLWQDKTRRYIATIAQANDQLLELSYVKFDTAGIKHWPQIHRAVMAGQSMGKAFRDQGWPFYRQVRAAGQRQLPASFRQRFGDDRPATVVRVDIAVGSDRLPYAQILETYSPAVTWPGLRGQLTIKDLKALDRLTKFLDGRQRVLLIDNYDSFTYNLYQQIADLGHDVKVVKHDAIGLEEIAKQPPSHIVISPGPKRPADSGISLAVIKHFYKRLPILGVCLGHQCLGEAFGSQIIQAPTIMHGKVDSIYHTQTGLFKAMPNPLQAARYHSLVVDQVPVNFNRTAWASDQSIMGLQHDQYPLFGVQFHPESFLSQHGRQLMRNFLA